MMAEDVQTALMGGGVSGWCGACGAGDAESKAERTGRFAIVSGPLGTHSYPSLIMPDRVGHCGPPSFPATPNASPQGLVEGAGEVHHQAATHSRTPPCTVIEQGQGGWSHRRGWRAQNTLKKPGGKADVK